MCLCDGAVDIEYLTGARNLSRRPVHSGLQRHATARSPCWASLLEPPLLGTAAHPQRKNNR